MSHSLFFRIAAMFCLLLPTLAAAGWRGNVALEGTAYPNDALFPAQKDRFPAMSMEVEYTHPFHNSDYSLTVTPFFRIDDFDQERTHADFRELKLHLARNDWEWDIGLIKVFWGVTESRHLVDIINQTDLVENLDGEDKLGQPALHGLWYRDWGALEFFALPGFRERTFPGKYGRLRGPLPVDTGRARYESTDRDQHLDYAFRASGTFKDNWDVGLSWFSGTSRDPVLQLDASGRRPRLIPFYPLIDQLGLDLQATLENWLWKLEAIYRDQPDDAYFAEVGGFEYTFYGIADSAADLGVLMEYHHDSRGRDAPTPFQNDLFIGGRWALNDAQSAEVLAGGFFDLDQTSRSWRVEASRRIGQNWKISAEMQIFDRLDPREPQYPLRNDDFVRLELARYF
ncbi:MAG TPA: hypothetical protein ENK26_10110 [Gammaproteobacteria bacterium]|nr:hypothetical protein [Gammaproteobacteria bacterium]